MHCKEAIGEMSSNEVKQGNNSEYMPSKDRFTLLFPIFVLMFLDLFFGPFEKFYVVLFLFVFWPMYAGLFFLYYREKSRNVEALGLV